MSAVERSRALRVARMEPHLQFMAGPLLRYDTVDSEAVWHGAAMVITADSGSFYEPLPTLIYEWDPSSKAGSDRHSFDLGPHPADPRSTAIPTAPVDGVHTSATACKESVPGQDSTFTFWRFMLHIPLGSHEMEITYSINRGQILHFFVPRKDQNMRWAAYSCNGFSAGVNPDDFRGPGYKSGYDPLWMDLLSKHAQEPFHALMGGGDQIYCDSLTREPELQEWVTRTRPLDRKMYPVTEEIEQAIDRFFFNHYCQHFRSGAFARANCSIPMINMCVTSTFLVANRPRDPDDMQNAPVFKCIGSRGYFYFLLFQCFINPEVDGRSDAPSAHVFRSTIIGSPGPYMPYPSHSILTYLGPQTQILLVDCRAERKKEQVCSPEEYQKVFGRLNKASRVEHLIVQLGVPIAYPRLVFLENALGSKLNPLVALGRAGSLGLSGFVNKFNAEAELLDDLNDHWTARSHKKERNEFVRQLQAFALTRATRITFITGDVHCAAVGLFHTLKGKGRPDIEPAKDHRYMINVTTSAIVNTPPPAAVIALVNSLSTKKHRTLHSVDTDETMLPVFAKDTDGSACKQKYIIGRRNYCQIDWDAKTGDLVFDIRLEKEKGIGQTVGRVYSSWMLFRLLMVLFSYPVRVPAPRWSS
ncbi:hypothetical protein FISHEDRAFT_37727 [Fistulina hepatica ATCC 64428]|nr:hypothetical protein FISHEDRAFT_37727 [Fistulina hepatica ATCC 64428]